MHLSLKCIPRVTALTATAASLLLARPVSADFYLHSWENQRENPRTFRFRLDAGYFRTQNNYDGAGKLLIPTDFGSYSRIQTDFTAAYGISSRLSAYVRAGWSRSELDTVNQYSTNFGFTDSSAGMTLRAFDFSTLDKPDALAIDIQVQGDFPFYSNENLTGPALGDGTIDVTGGAFVTWPIVRIKSSLLTAAGGAGFTFRSSDFSKAIPWSASVGLAPRDDGFSIKAMLAGLTSLNTDPRAQGLSVSSTAQSAQSGGSFITNAVNPSLMTVRGEVGYQFGKDLGLTAFAAQSIWGQAAPNGFYAGAAIQARLGGHPSKSGAQLSGPDYGRSNQGFVNYSSEARITRTNDRLNLVKIDKGSQDGVEVGQVYDIFMIRKDGSVGEAVARGHVTNTLMNEAAVSVDEYFKEVWIDEGFVAKRPVQ